MLTIDAHVDTPWVLTKYGFGSLDLSEWAATKNLNHAVFAVYLSAAWQKEHGLAPVDAQLEWIGDRPFCIEGAHLLGKDPIKRLTQLVGAGRVPKYLTLVHNITNDLADSATDKPKHRGISDLGRNLIETCHLLGIHVDISHASEAAALECLEIGPVIASHSGCAAVTPHPRNLSDAILNTMAQQDSGIICIPFARNFLTHSTFHDHVAHAVNIGGSTFVGVGSDLDGAALVPAFLKTYNWEAFVVDGLRDKGLADLEIEEIAGFNLGIVLDI